MPISNTTLELGFPSQLSDDICKDDNCEVFVQIKDFCASDAVLNLM